MKAFTIYGRTSAWHLQFTIGAARWRAAVWAGLVAVVGGMLTNTATAWPGAPASQAMVSGGTNSYLWVTPQTLAGWQTNASGASDPLAAGFMTANGITDPVVGGKLSRFCARLRTMAAFTNLQNQFLFNQAYNPTNGRDLFGKTITWNTNAPNGMPAFTWGATCYFTNMGKFPVPQTTNWTIIVVKRNYNAGDCTLSANGYGWYDEFSLENTNSDSFNFLWGHQARLGFQFMPTSGGWLGMNSNVGSSYLLYTGANGPVPPPEVPPAVWVVEANGGASIWGSVDTLPLLSTNAVTNIMVNANVCVTNTSPVQFVTVGGSTNWNRQGTHLISGNDANAVSNALCEVYSVAFFNTAMSSNDVNIYYSAIAETYPSNRHWCQIGDSMMAEANNYVLPYYGMTTETNFIMFQFAQRHPNDMWHDWAAGGSTLHSYIANLNPRMVTMLPPGSDVTIICDMARNDTYTNGVINIAATNAYVALALAPWLTTGAKCWLYESPMGSTNVFGNGTCYTNPARLNLYNSYKGLETNPIFNRVLHVIDYFTGPVWDTNSGYFGWGVANGAGFANPGFHIEGTNSPLFMQNVATYWDTGEWPTAMPALDPTLNMVQTAGSFSGNFNGQLSVTGPMALSTNIILAPAIPPGYAGMWSSNGWLFYVTAQHPAGLLLSAP
jgi:hypothetical protein